MDNNQEREKKIAAIDAEIRELYKKVGELDQQKFEIDFQENIEYAKDLVGKYFKHNTFGDGVAIFHPTEVDSSGHRVRIIGFHAQGTLYAIGDRSAFIHSKEEVSVQDSKEYIEISKEEFNMVLTEILDFEI